MGVVAKRSSMTFYSDGTSQYSHRVRIVLAEKGVTVETIDVDPDKKPEDLASLNPYNSLPTLVDRDLVLYEADIMVARAMSRLWIYRIKQDWCPLVDKLMAKEGTPAQLEKARKELRDSLVSIAAIFGEKPYFMSDEFTIVDCCVMPILWRLPVMGIELPKTKGVKPLLDYRNRLFERESVILSLSEQEKEMV